MLHVSDSNPKKQTTNELYFELVVLIFFFNAWFPSVIQKDDIREIIGISLDFVFAPYLSRVTSPTTLKQS